MLSIDNSINPKEMTMVEEILKRYSVVPEKIEKVRSVYRIYSADGIYCLKKASKGSKKAIKVMHLTEYLKNNGFNNVAKFYKTSENKEYVRLHKNVYYLTDWINGHECSCDNKEEMEHAAALLAHFHISAKGFSNSSLKNESSFKNWQSILKEDMQDLLRFRKMIYMKKIKTTFDIQYYDAIEAILGQMDKSIKLLENSNYISLSKYEKGEKTVCHDSFYYQNIIVDNENNMFIIDLDSAAYDITVYDLGKFIRRLLYKSTYSWDFEFARALIEAYSQVKPLSPEELEILLPFIIFPHKFWKLGIKRYVKRKRWSEETYIKKLRRFLRFIDKQNEFIDKYLDYYKIGLQ